MKLDHIEIENVYSFQAACLNLGDVTHIVGPNNSGKSNFVRILRVLKEGRTSQYNLQDSQKFVRSGVTSPDCSLRLNIRLSEDEAKKILQFFMYLQQTQDDTNDDFNLAIESLVGDFRSLTLTLKWHHDESELVTTPDLQVHYHDPDLFIQKNGNSEIYSPVQYPTKRNDHTISYLLNNYYRKGLIEKGELRDFLKQSLANEYMQYWHSQKISKSRATKVFRDLSKYTGSDNVDFFSVFGAILSKGIHLLDEVRDLHPTTMSSSDAELSYNSSNLANHLYSMHKSDNQSMSEKYNQIQSYFTSVFNSLSFRVTEEDNICRIKIMDGELGVELPIEQTGAGVRETLFLLTRLISHKDAIIIYDEPALHLHPTQIRTLKRKMVEIAKEASLDVQLVIITHSPYFIGPAMFEDNVEMVCVARKGGASKVTQVARSEDKEWIGNHSRRMNPPLDPQIFFSKSVLLVEGDADLGLIYALSQHHFPDLENDLDLEKNDVYVVPVGGKDRFLEYSKILSLFEMKYVIFADRDALMNIGNGRQSAILRSILETHSNDRKMIESEISKIETEAITRQPKWADAVTKCAGTYHNLIIDNFAKDLIKKNSTEINQYAASRFDELRRLCYKYMPTFIIPQGELEDLLRFADEELFEKLKERYNKTTRLFIRDFVEQLDVDKLEHLDVPKDAIINVISLSKEY